MILDLKKVEPKILGNSQKGQDSYIDYIFQNIGMTNKYFVEFGARDGYADSNTSYLREQGWNGLLLDCIAENESINLHKRFLSKDNIVGIFKEFNVPQEFDFLSVDIDGNDYWLLQEILKEFSPYVIMVETNVRFSPETDLVQRYDENWFWQGYGWYGASPRAMKKMVEKYSYSPLFIHLDDMFFVKNDILDKNNLKSPTWSEIYNSPRISLYDDHKGNIFNPEMWITPN